MDRLLPGSSGGSVGGIVGGSSEKGGKKKKKTPFNRTYRFNLKLTFDDAKSYPDFNWLDIVAKEEEDRLVSKRKELQEQKQLDPYASDDEDQLQALAKKFEEKYGGATEKIKKKKKARKLDDYADLGYGYDSDDPFIDNSEVHDEIVPENLTTAHGGFYVNSGEYINTFPYVKFRFQSRWFFRSIRIQSS